MSDRLKKFSEEFFCNLKCDVIWVLGGHDSGEPKESILKVGNVPKSFEDLIGCKSPYKLSFVETKDRDLQFVGKGSRMLAAMTKFLEGAGKTTLLRIDFEVDAEAEIQKRVGLNNCEIDSFTKKYKNNFFSRFSFVTTFNYLNESERVLSEVYVHEGLVVDGSLDGYTVVDGDSLRVNGEQVKKYYVIAKEKATELAMSKQVDLSDSLREKIEREVSRIKEHYDKALNEQGSDLNNKLEKIREAQLELRGAEGDARDVLKKKLDRLRGSLVKAGDDEVVDRIMKEKDLTIRDVMHKHSLNVDRKLVNTTVIYYPVYTFRLCLKVADNKSFVDVGYDPLTKKFTGLNCEVCEKTLGSVSLCEGGHICCGDCLGRCGDCGKVFCDNCLSRSCKSCGKKLCKGCVKKCLGCGGVVCSTHLRKDCVSGEDRCVNCLRACLRCHGMCEERFFGEALDGSKVCQKCLGAEKRGAALGKIFRR